MERTNIYLDEEQSAALDAVARAEGISRAELVRRLIDRGISAMPLDLAADVAAIEQSFGVWGDGDVPDRGPDARSAHLDRLSHR